MVPALSQLYPVCLQAGITSVLWAAFSPASSNIYGFYAADWLTDPLSECKQIFTKHIRMIHLPSHSSSAQPSLSSSLAKWQKALGEVIEWAVSLSLWWFFIVVDEADEHT